MRERPRHVLMTADTVGGVWTFALELTRTLMSRGIGVSLATAGRPLSKSQWEQAKAAGDPAIFESSFRLEWQDDPWSDVDRAGDWLRNLAATLNPDVVHLNDYSNAAPDWDAAVVVTGHSCVLSWFRAVHRSEAPSEWGEYRRRVERGLHSADVVAAPSHAMLACLEQHYGALPNPKVVPNGRAASLFHPVPKQPLILAAGRIWDEAKNIQSLARIAGELPWRVFVAGEQNGLTLENVTALGLLEPAQLASWMSRASIYCLPAKYEPFGLSVLEAALSGCALVLGDIESLRENWDDCALFVDPEDPKALSAALLSLIGNESLRRALAAKARERAKRFSPEAMAHGYLDAYRMALGASRELTLTA